MDRRTLLALGAAGLVGAAAARTVEHGTQATTTIAVSSAGLDLSRTGDASLMLGRLDRAALSACGASAFGVREHQAAVRRTACYREAMDRAVASVDAPALGALYQARAPQVATR
jgi:UrcA family protein